MNNIKMIAAVSLNGIIGVDGDIPWMGKYPSDMKFFREQTKGATVIMGRATLTSMGNKPLPKRRNIIVSKNQTDLIKNIPGIEIASSVEEAIGLVGIEKTYLIGGNGIYLEGMKYTDEILLTQIPEWIDVNNKQHASFPFINPSQFSLNLHPITLDGDLKVYTYCRI